MAWTINRRYILWIDNTEDFVVMYKEKGKECHLKKTAKGREDNVL